MMFCVT